MTSGRPPIVGGDHRDAAVHGLEGRQAETLLLARQEKQVGAEKERLELVLFSHELDVGVELQLPDELLDEQPLRPVADQQELGRDAFADPGENAHDVRDPLHRAEIGGVHQDLLAPRRQRLPASTGRDSPRAAAISTKLGMTRISRRMSNSSTVRFMR